jgi:hypothetical protein
MGVNVMDDIENECKLMKHDLALRRNEKYRDLDCKIVSLEKEILSKSDNTISNLFLRYTNLLSEQNAIFINELLKIQ